MYPWQHNGRMCERFTLTADRREVLDHFGIRDTAVPLSPAYNIGPLHAVAAVRQGVDARELVMLRWGLVPSTAKELPKGPSMINAGAQNMDQKPAFRNAFRRRRCLIPADGFYAWQKIADDERPYRFTVGGGVFAFAGLWERWTAPDGQTVESCAIITTEANDLVRQIHDRMPVIVDPANYGFWLDPENTDAAALRPLLAPHPSAGMRGFPVSRKVNGGMFDAPGAIVPVGEELDAAVS
jgi:putative SOS response-associated peptidase YedK